MSDERKLSLVKTKTKKRSVVVHAEGDFERKTFVDDVGQGQSEERMDMADGLFDSLSMGERVARHLFKRDPTTEEILRCVELLHGEQRMMLVDDLREDVDKISEEDPDTG